MKREIAKLLKLFKETKGELIINDVWILHNNLGLISFVQRTNEPSCGRVYPLLNLNEENIINFLKNKINFDSLPLEELKNKLEEYLIEKI